MGDRGNIIIQGGSMFPHPVYLYTHWGGSELAATIARALDDGRPRWDDPAYLARIIFHTLLDGDTGETGFGLSTAIGDGEDQCWIVDVEAQTVVRKGSKDKPLSFSEWVKTHN